MGERSVFIRWLWGMGALALACGLMACAGGGGGVTPERRPVPSAPAGGVPVAPLKIPMPLDRAGHRVDVIFDIPEPPRGQRARGYFVGLRMPFAPTDPEGRIAAIDAHPVEVRVTLHRLEAGGEVAVRMVRWTDVSKPHEQPRRYESIPLTDDVATTRGEFSEHSGAPPGTPDASTYVMSLGAPKGDAPGRYRLSLETLRDRAELRGVTTFLVFEQLPKR